jgi:4-amino-4-deoxy-L-arabinose transferase-like glycosyltransferase
VADAPTTATAFSITIDYPRSPRRRFGTILSVRRPVLTLVVLSSLTFGAGLDRPVISDADEAYYAEAAREMVESGDWLTPHYNYVDRWEKPALYYWLTAALYEVAGPGEGVARLWSAASGVGLVLLTFAAGRRLTGRDEAGWLAAAMVATSFGYFALARMALPDLPLACAVTAGVWAALRAGDTVAPRARRCWWLLAGAAAGVGFLTKGPVALAVPGVVLLPLWWLERRTIRLGWGDTLAAGAVAAAIGLPWYVAMAAVHGLGYLESFFLSDNLARFATDRFNDPRPFWFYVPVVLGGLVPWTAFLLLMPAPSRLIGRGVRLAREEWRLLLWTVMPLLLFTASIGKQPRYILPVLPPLAILLARALLARLDEAAAGSATARRRLAAASWTTAALLAALALVLLRARPLFPDALPLTPWIAAAGLTAGAVALAMTAARRLWARLPAVMTIAAAVLLLAGQAAVLSGPRPAPVERIAALVSEAHAPGTQVATYNVFARNLVFYTGLPQVQLYDDTQALTFLRGDGPVLLAAPLDDLERLERLSGIRLRRLGETKYLNAAALRLGQLLFPLPAQDLETIALVTNR